MKNVVLLFLILLAACSTSSPATTSTSGSSAATNAPSAPGESTTTSLLPSVTATTPLDVIGVFLAVVDVAMEGTEFEGYAIDEPEDVLIVGQVFCEMRDAGYSDEESLMLHLQGLAELREVTDADALFAGTVMGAAFETLCPTTE